VLSLFDSLRLPRQQSPDSLFQRKSAPETESRERLQVLSFTGRESNGLQETRHEAKDL
jgi:hypothetical protein